MNLLPNDQLALMLVFAFGLRHGLDADHLATVDGLTRCNAGRRIAAWCGSLFSLGHGTVVTLVAVGSGLLASRWIVPPWIEDFGVWTSVFFLTALGLLNLRAVAICQRDQVVQPVGLKGRLFGRLQFTRNPWLIVLIGALFALSFDTLTLAALFSLATRETGSGQTALGLGLAFTLGMLVTDGVNGLWISRLLCKADRTARIASRVMGYTVGMLSLLVAAWGFGRYVSPALQAWSSDKAWMIGGSVVVAIAASFLAAIWLARLRLARAEA